ncbi:hypothetical protein CEW89_19710 [Celeribacter ethanolicus]|uniref:Uncharacterized protein n=1 Tax=Celeribacter ethanolicus TaxID=1758178 RepID=A0A291GHG3_9RHOB|nr:hypothetical protein [Celeribacter ethanolicus]ATG49598.1 hypothetical protein CEW89_19710 [Celeribacter ethanolicus]
MSAPSSSLSHPLPADALSALVTDTLARAPLQSHRGRVQTIGALQARIAREGVSGLSTQEARLELDKLISRRLLLLGVPCDLPILAIPQASNEEEKDAPLRATPEPQFAAWDHDLAEERATDFAELPVIFTRAPGLRGWFKRFRSQPKPPGKVGKARGPSGPVTHLSRTVETATGTLDYYAAWRYDPACHLMVRLACDGRRRFLFGTRCDSFAHAFEHLGATLARRGMALRLKGLSPGATWADSAPECETLHLPDGRLVHALSLDTEPDPAETMMENPVTVAPQEA